MRDIPEKLFVFTVALMCHGSVLYKDQSFSHNSRLIALHNTEMDCPTFFSAIDTFLDSLHNKYHKDLTKNTHDIIKTHQSVRIFPLLFEKLLFYDPTTWLETASIKLGSVFRLNNQHKDGIYLISIHKKTQKGLQNIAIGNPMNLMLTESWTQLNTIMNVCPEYQVDIGLLNSEKSLTEKFYETTEKSFTKKSHVAKYNKLEILEKIVDEEQLQIKKKDALAFKLHTTTDGKRITEIKLSTVLELLSQLGTGNSEIGDKGTPGIFFNVYDFTCNGFASSMSAKEKDLFKEEFNALKNDFEIHYQYGGVKKRNRFSKKRGGRVRRTQKRKQ